MSVPKEILDDLSSRFLIHLPSEEKKDPTRLCFTVELAYWFYLDYYAGEGSKLPSLSMHQFTFALFSHNPSMRHFAKRVDEIIATWKTFKFAVPTFGCILIDEALEHVLLVQGYWSKGTWGFPKGKINENEKQYVCAAREVQEEIGFDCRRLIDKRCYLERRIGDHDQRLYIVSGISRDTIFIPQTKKEIRSIRWFNINDLPSFKKDPTPTERLGINSNNFFMIMPFVKPLRKWLNQKRQEAGLPVLPSMNHSRPTPSESGSQKTSDSSRSRSQSVNTNQWDNLTQNKQQQQQQQSKKKAKSSKPDNTVRKSLTKMFDEAAKRHENEQRPQSLPQVTEIKENRTVIISSPKKKYQPIIPAYKCPDFDVPAWSSFKLNFDDYAKLVY